MNLLHSNSVESDIDWAKEHRIVLLLLQKNLVVEVDTYKPDITKFTADCQLQNCLFFFIIFFLGGRQRGALV